MHLHTQAHPDAHLHAPLKEIDLPTFVKALYAYKAWVLASVLIGFLIGLVISQSQPPIYQSSALIQVMDPESNSNASALLSSLGVFQPKLGGKNRTAIEMTLMHSDYITKPTVQKLGLDVLVTPHTFPILGPIFKAHYHGQGPAPAKFYLTGYAWGGEKIHLSRFNPPLEHYTQRYTLIADGKETYHLLDPSGNLILRGQVGSLAQSSDGTTNILVDTLSARPSTSFFISHLDPTALAHELNRRLKLTELSPSDGGSANTGIIQLNLNTSQPKETSQILNTIIALAAQDNENQKNKQSGVTAQFIQNQLILAQKNLKAAENNLNREKARTGSINLNAESSLLLNEISNLDSKIFTDEIEKDQLLQNNTAKSPLVESINTELISLKNQRTKIKNKLANLPLQEQNTINLMRDTQIKNKLYSSLQNSLQQTMLTQASSLNSIRVLNYAEAPVLPLPTKTPFILIFSSLAGLLFSSFGILLFTQVRRGITDPYWAEKTLNLKTWTILPFSKTQAENDKQMQGKKLKKRPLLSQENPHDGTLEALRHLSQKFLIPSKKKGHQKIAVFSASPQAGKSFIMLNLAIILAEAQQRVLLIDADLHHGELHQVLHLPLTPGLAEYLAQSASAEAVIHHTSISGLDLITSGHPTTQTDSSLYAHFPAKTQALSPLYDFILIDTPPILACSSVHLLAQASSMNILLIPAAAQEADLEAALAYFDHEDIKIDGTLFNFTKKIHALLSNHPHANPFFRHRKSLKRNPHA